MTKPADRSAEPPRDVEAALARVRAAGGRVTDGLRRLLELLFEHRAGMSVEEVVAALASSDPTTVYRSLVRLEQIGVIEHVHFGHRAAVYRIAGAATITVRCESCGALTAVPASEFDALFSRLGERYGVDIHVGHVALSGRCAGGCGEAVGSENVESVKVDRVNVASESRLRRGA